MLPLFGLSLHGQTNRVDQSELAMHFVGKKAATFELSSEVFRFLADPVFTSVNYISLSGKNYGMHSKLKSHRYSR